MPELKDSAYPLFDQDGHPVVIKQLVGIVKEANFWTSASRKETSLKRRIIVGLPFPPDAGNVMKLSTAEGEEYFRIIPLPEGKALAPEIDPEKAVFARRMTREEVQDYLGLYDGSVYNPFIISLGTPPKEPANAVS